MAEAVHVNRLKALLTEPNKVRGLRYLVFGAGYLDLARTVHSF